jgi:hypothetical protein
MGKKGNTAGEPYVMLLKSVLECPAWKELSHGATRLYTYLKGEKSNYSNRAYLSYRDAQRATGASLKKIAEWFAELKHYGFIVLETPHSLGVDGKGKAPHWRLTDSGRTSKSSASGLREDPTKDYLRWDGVLFDPKPYRRKSEWLKNPVNHVGNTPSTTWDTPLSTTWDTPQPGTVNHGGDIESGGPVNHGGDITSLATTVAFPGLPPTPPPTPSEGSSEDENAGGPSEAKIDNVVYLDPRIEALEAAERRSKK